MTSDNWLAYETSADNVFQPTLFIKVYAIVAVVSLVFCAIRSYLLSYKGLKTAQIYFQQILNSIVHALMLFFDTSPSGRILTRDEL